jgi:hypothetical protein
MSRSSLFGSANGRRGAAGRRERGAALVIAILVLAILTVIGIALMLITSTESRIAANEWSVNRAFYSADAGIRWAQIEMAAPKPFLKRPEFQASTFGTVFFQMPSWKHGAFGSPTGFFTGDKLSVPADPLTGTDIQVLIQTPSLIGRRFIPGMPLTQGMYSFELRSTGGQNDTSQTSSAASLQYSKALVADVEIGPLPESVLPF